MQDIEAKYLRSVEVLCASYNEFMRKMAPAPTFLPIRVKVVFSDKPALLLENIAVQPFDGLADLIKALEGIFVQRGDPIINWNLQNLRFRV